MHPTRAVLKSKIIDFKLLREIMKVRLTLLAALLIAVPRLIYAQDIDLNDLLQKMQAANGSAKYQGTLTTVIINASCPKIYQYEIINLGNHQRHEEMLTESENKQVSYDDGHYLWRFFPYKNLLIKEPTRQISCSLLQSAQTLELVKKNYHINVEGIYTINERNGYRLRFTPKKTDRPQVVYWIDAATGVPLKIEKYGSDNQLVSISSFSKLNFQIPHNQGLFLKVPSHTLVAEVNEKGHLTIRKARSLMGNHVAAPAYLPSGFIQKNICLKNQGNKKILQMFYTDGLTSLSVYQEPYDPQKSPIAEDNKVTVQGREASLSTSGTINTLTVPTKPLTSTLIGEVFPDEITKIAASLFEATDEPLSPPNP